MGGLWKKLMLLSMSPSASDQIWLLNQHSAWSKRDSLSPQTLYNHKKILYCASKYFKKAVVLVSKCQTSCLVQPNQRKLALWHRHISLSTCSSKSRSAQLCDSASSLIRPSLSRALLIQLMDRGGNDITFIEHTSFNRVGVG